MPTVQTNTPAENTSHPEYKDVMGHPPFAAGQHSVIGAIALKKNTPLPRRFLSAALGWAHDITATQFQMPTDKFPEVSGYDQTTSKGEAYCRCPHPSTIVLQ
ncbi:MAG: hypothetical protein HC919_07450 [Oscillatoriales cyanobacterium SM2_2_1]|nr:hypothetical protein [Oscillatoriales cyanobacterium SM2_2_1]